MYAMAKTACGMLAVSFALLLAVPAWGQTDMRSPHIGYLYPAGGAQGKTLEILAGGQRLYNARSVHVSGEGVRATVLRYVKPLGPQDLQDIKREVQAALRKGAKAGKFDERTVADLDLPDHPLIDNLEHLSLSDLRELAGRLRMQPPSRQIAEIVVIEISIAPDATPGPRELRVITQNGMTNPLDFHVGPDPEFLEVEPNNKREASGEARDLPAVFNGQILPGDVDMFRFRAEAGQRLVMAAQARRLIPYLADAVPGWFQATLTLYDGRGQQVAFADDYGGNPDPVLLYEVGETGEYTLEIRDAIYRGREDFVYRISAGELPLVTAVYPLGTHEGAPAEAAISGWNLPTGHLTLRMEPGAFHTQELLSIDGRLLAVPMVYAVDALPDFMELEPNNDVRDTTIVDLPRIVNGRIAEPGDVDIFRFAGRAGDSISAEVWAHRLGSPLDAVLHLVDGAGNELSMNDDQDDPESGLITHHADACLTASLPNNGDYYIRLSDAQGHGGAEFAYRLEIGPTRPDFALRVTPASLTVRASRSAAAWVHAFRKGGFDGDIELALADGPAGFVLSGSTIPRGCDKIQVTVTAPRDAPVGPVELSLEGRGNVDGETLRRRVQPAEDMLQAFIYRHLVPARYWMALVAGMGRRGLAVSVDADSPLRIAPGGTAEVRVHAPPGPRLKEIRLELGEPPKGVTLQEAAVLRDGFQLTFAADAATAEPGTRGNLIVEASIAPPEQEGKKKKQAAQRLSLGVLPALPFEITNP